MSAEKFESYFGALKLDTSGLVSGLDGAKQALRGTKRDVENLNRAVRLAAGNIHDVASKTETSSVKTIVSDVEELKTSVTKSRKTHAPSYKEILKTGEQNLGNIVSNAILGKGGFSGAIKQLLQNTKMALMDSLTTPNASIWAGSLQEKSQPGSQSLSSSIVNWTKGKGRFDDVEITFKDMASTVKAALKDLGKQELDRLTDNLVKAALTGKDAFKMLGQDVGALFRNITRLISSDIGKLAAQAYGVLGLFSKEKKTRKKSLLGGLLGAAASVFIPGAGFSVAQGLMYGSAAGQALFDNPLNDTLAVRVGQNLTPTRSRSDSDLLRLLARGLSTDAGRVAPAPSVVDNRQTVNVSTRIDRVTSIEDLERISETQAWIISKRLKLARG